MVIRGGENVYPREVEEFLYRHKKIADVQVIGVPDRKYGEELCAWVKLKPGETATAEEIQAFCRGQIAHYKVPRYIRFVDAFPMTVTGKVQKFMMRAEMIRSWGWPKKRPPEAVSGDAVISSRWFKKSVRPRPEFVMQQL